MALCAIHVCVSFMYTSCRHHASGPNGLAPQLRYTSKALLDAHNVSLGELIHKYMNPHLLASVCFLTTPLERKKKTLTTVCLVQEVQRKLVLKFLMQIQLETETTIEPFSPFQANYSLFVHSAHTSLEPLLYSLTSPFQKSLLRC